MSDGSVLTLHSGKGHYKSLSFDENFTQAVFLSDQAEYDKPVSPYRVYYWRVGDAAAVELVSATTKGMPPGTVVADAGGGGGGGRGGAAGQGDTALRFAEDGQRVVFFTGPPPAPVPAPAPDPNAPRKPAPIPVDLWSYKDPQIQPMQRARVQQEQNRSYRAIFHMNDKRVVQLASAICRPSIPAPIPTGHRHLGCAVRRDLLGSELPRHRSRRYEVRQSPQSARALRPRSDDVAGGKVPPLL
jgi:hypothetical protein